jgi:hypothetical protein
LFCRTPLAPHPAEPPIDRSTRLRDTALVNALRRANPLGKTRSYAVARARMFTWLRRSQGAIADVYGGRTFEIPPLMAPERIFSRQQARRPLEAMAALHLNCEHRWPTSLGGPRSDLINLAPSEIEANSRRLRYPYGVVHDESWSNGQSKLGRNAQGVMVFEPPDSDKGPAARALLGLLLLYGSRAAHHFGEAARLHSQSWLEVQMPVLKEWNRRFPVNAWERLLNEAAIVSQGHNNPFIEHPELIERIDDFRALLDEVE